MVAWLCVHFHGQATLIPTIAHHINTSKNTRTLTGVTNQTHSQRHRRRIQKIPEQTEWISPSQEHEHWTQENRLCSNQREVDQGVKRHGDGVQEQVLRGVDGLTIRAIQTNHTPITHAKPRQDVSDVQLKIPDRYHVWLDGNGARIRNSGEFNIFYWQLADMGVAKIFATHEYTHAYCIWKIIAADDRTWVLLKAHFQGTYMDWEYLRKTSGAAGYGSANNVKHEKMEDDFMHFVSETASRDADFIKMTTTNGNLSTQLRQQEYHIRVLKA